MSEPLYDEAEAEVIDGLPVLPEEPVDPMPSAPAPGSRALAIRFAAPVQAVTAAIGGFLAGAAIVGFVQRRNRRAGKPARRFARGDRRKERGARGAASELVQVVASRSLLVDVHLLGSSRNER